MLVIRRRIGESLLIGEAIEIEILDLTSSHAKLGIRAPKEVPVVRSEISIAAQANRNAVLDALAGVDRKFPTQAVARFKARIRESE